MSFDSDLLDDILTQPTSAPERALGKFLPKARRKNEKVVQRPISSDRPVQDGERIPTEHAPKELSFAEGCMDIPGFPLCDSNSNDCLRRDQGSSVQQTEIILPGSDSLDDILPQLATTTDRVMGKFQPKVRPNASKLVPPSLSPTCTYKSVSSGLDPAHCAPNPFEAQEFIRNSHPENTASDGDKELQTDYGKSEGKETRVLTSLEPLRDGLFQAPKASEAPMLGAAASGIDGNLQTDEGPSGEETLSATFDTGSVDKDFTQPDMTTCLEAIVSDHNVDLQVDHGRLQGEEESELYEDIPLQPTLSAARGVGKFQPKLGAKIKKAKTTASDSCVAMEPAGSSEALSPEIESHKSPVLAFPPDSSTSLELPTNDILGNNARVSALEAVSPDNRRKSDNYHGIMERDGINGQKRKSFRQEASGKTVEDQLQGILDGGSSATEDVEVNDANQAFRQLRKRTSVCPVVNELDDENDDDWELGTDKSNDSQMGEESSDDKYTGQRSSKRRTPRKSRGFQGEKEKPPRGHKKASFGSDSSTQEPHKKKFSHSTRRSRRRVDKVLLEAPEEDIDPTKLRIKDLIMLAEARERIAVKEAATMRQSTRDQSESSFRSFGDDNQEQGLNVDGDEANDTVHFSSTKLNYHTYMTRTRSDRWSKVDTELFYQAVRQFGTDFAMIQQLFPNRTRHQIKLKFKNEERKHPLQIADALVHRSKDHSQFELVIQRLQAQEEENSNGDAADDTRDESQTKTTENEEEDHVKVDKKEEEEVDDWDQVHDSVNPNEYQDVFDWSQYEFHNSSSPYGMEKDEYNLF